MAKAKTRVHAAQKSAARKTAAVSKVSPKRTAGKSAPRRVAAKVKSARPSRSASSVDTPTGAPPQRLAVSHYDNADFKSGLRAYAQYRDLGIAEATHGMAQAHVLRFTEPCNPEVVSKLHYHDTQFQMVYVLKGWVKTELGDAGEITMRQGSAWTQPPMIRHKINDYSEDCELLEIILPAEFDTVEL